MSVTTTTTDSNMTEQLNEAKANVRWLLDHGSGLVDMHGLTYWAGVVERLRLKIREAL
jgi:hypothetical protein